jgi:hypothetical protein
MKTGRSGGGLRHPTGGDLPFAAQSEDGKADRVQRLHVWRGALRSGGLSAGSWPSGVDALCGLCRATATRQVYFFDCPFGARFAFGYSHHWEAIFYGHTRTMKSMISTSVGLCQEAVTKPFNASAYLTTNQIIPVKLALAATALNVAVPAAR